jgi:hypothetical protein
MAGVIAADNEWRIRKMIVTFDDERAIRKEKYPAESLKQQAADGRRQEHALRFAPVCHSRSVIGRTA